MKLVRPKCSVVRLDPRLYAKLRKEVLQRDGWRCQWCGAMSNLEVHHQQFRSHCGDDAERNLITLCAACHTSVHSD
jgi:5-methylcytosine-specific restriction endonuclease McrA